MSRPSRPRTTRSSTTAATEADARRRAGRTPTCSRRSSPRRSRTCSGTASPSRSCARTSSWTWRRSASTRSTGRARLSRSTDAVSPAIAPRNESTAGAGRHDPRPHAQPLGTLAAFLLDPQSEDGLTTWNFFDDGLAGRAGLPGACACRPRRRSPPGRSGRSPRSGR